MGKLQTRWVISNITAAKPPKNDSPDIEIPYDKALYLFDAIRIAIDELGKETDNIIALRTALGKLVNQ